MRDKGSKVENKVRNSTYMKDAMRRAMTKITKLSMVAMYKDKMQANIKQFATKFQMGMAEALRQMEYRRDEARHQKALYHSHLQVELQAKGEAHKKLLDLTEQITFKENTLKSLSVQVETLQKEVEELNQKNKSLEEEVNK